MASFPVGVNRPVQYGLSLKANAVYMSQYQLILYDRVRDHFQDQMHIPLSAGSVFNFNKEACDRLDPFEQWAKQMQALLIEFAKAVEDAEGCLLPDEAKRWRLRYRWLLKKTEAECPPPDESQRKGKRGRLKRSKARNLLERLRDFEPDLLSGSQLPVDLSRARHDGHSSIDTAFPGQESGFYEKGRGLIGAFMTK